MLKRTLKARGELPNHNERTVAMLEGVKWFLMVPNANCIEVIVITLGPAVGAQFLGVSFHY